MAAAAAAPIQAAQVPGPFFYPTLAQLGELLPGAPNLAGALDGRTLSTHRGEILSMVVDPASNAIISGSDKDYDEANPVNGEVTVSPVTRSEPRTIAALVDSIHCLAVIDGGVLATGPNRQLHTLNPRTSSLRSTFPVAGAYISEIEAHPSKTSWLTASASGVVKWESNGEVQTPIIQQSVSHLAVDFEHFTLATANCMTLKTWDLDGRKLTENECDDEITAVTIDPNAKRVVCAFGQAVTVWDYYGRELVTHSLEDGGDEGIEKLAIDPRSRYGVAAANNGSLHIFSLSTPADSIEVDGISNPSSLEIDPTGRWILAGGSHQGRCAIVIHDTETGASRITEIGPSYPYFDAPLITAAQFHPSGGIVTGTHDGTVRLWKPAQ